MRRGALSLDRGTQHRRVRHFDDGGAVGALGDFTASDANPLPQGAVGQASAVAPQLFGSSAQGSSAGPLAQSAQYQQLRGQLDAANADRLQRINNAKSILQAAQGSQTANLPMLAAAAGMLRPTNTGGFSESLSNALGAAIPQIQQQRQQDQSSAEAQARLDMAYGDVAQQAASQALSEYGVNFFKTAELQRQTQSADLDQKKFDDTVRHEKAGEATTATSTGAQADYYKALADQANSTEYKYQTGLGVDPATGKQVQGAYKISDDPKESPQFMPGMILGDKAAAMALNGNSVGDDTYARMVANYQADPPAPRSRQTPDGKAFMSEVSKLNPDWNEVTYQGSKRAYNDYMAGNNSKTITAFDTAISHISLLKQYADALNNNPNSQTANAIGNAVATEFGSTAPTNYDSIAPVIADEVVKANIGSSGALGDREALVSHFKSKSTDDQIHGVADGYIDLMGSKMAVLAREYQGKTKRPDFTTTMGLTPEGIGILNRHLPTSFGGTQDKAPPPAPPTPPPLPPSVPAGSAYSPSRKMWRDPTGKMYDETGSPVP